MVKCNRCGVEVTDSLDVCPNCGNSLNEPKQETSFKSNDEIICQDCGAKLDGDVTFCSSCGSKIEDINENKCGECGSELPENVLFCPTCGTKVKQKQKSQISKTCLNCGFNLDEGIIFCPECGTNRVTGVKSKTQNKNSDLRFVDKIDLNSIIKPTLISIIVAILLSSIGLVIGFSWVSFIIAVVISVGFFAGLIDNEANAIVFGLFVGLILGLLENPLVEFWYGSFLAGVYEGVFGGQIILLIILGMICAYVSNIYLKDHIQDLACNFASWL